MNSFVMRETKLEAMQVKYYWFVVSRWWNSKENAIKNTYKRNSKIKIDQPWVETKNCFTLKMQNRSKQKKVNEAFIVEQQPWWKPGRGEWNKRRWGVFLLTPWLVGIKYPKKITLCDTNTIILLTIVIIIDT